MNNNRMPSDEVDYSGDPWHRALHECTRCLREQNAEDADACLAYLGLLEQKLRMEGITVGVDDTYNEDHSFPGIGVDGDSDSGGDNVIGAIDGDDGDDDHRVPANYPPSWSAFCSALNRMSASEAVQHGMAEGTKPIIDHSRGSKNPQRLPGKRLYTRIFTSRSEIFVLKATHAVRTDRDWKAVAAAYQTAIHQIHKALGVTDTAISRWWSQQELPQRQQRYGYRQQQLLHHQLVRDADIVEVALLSMTDHRDKMVADGKREEAKLLRKLQPQWVSRDEVKERWGADRWKNNPSPKFDYAKMRAELEQRLESLRKAMESLEGLDLGEALRKASGMREHLIANNNNRENGPRTRTTEHGKQNQEPAVGQKHDRQQQQKHRYNNVRPSPAWMQQRVPLLDYPDPVDLGWTFTGSHEAVEFFERVVSEKLVKLDWYFTTATVKTSLDHPTQGRTQLFAKRCDPRLYAKVLTNPRTHTGHRYQRKNRSSKQSR